MTTPPFVIFALPRARTFWLSRFLSHGDYHCGHDEIQHMRSLDDVKAWFTQPFIGTVETAAAPFWRLLMHYQPDVCVVTIRRNRADVLASIMRALPGCDPDGMHTLLRAGDVKLDQIEARVPGVLSVRYEDLAQEEGCGRVFQHCLGRPLNHNWWQAWNAINVSGNLLAQVRYARAYLPQLQKLARVAKHAGLAIMGQQTSRPPEGFTFQDEPIDRWYADATVLFREHMAVTGQDIEDWGRKNIGLGRRMDAAGAMQIMTARSNGRMFGYVMSIIGPSLDDPNALVAQQMPIFADPSCPGLGMKLQRASIAALRCKGITEVLGRSGTRGSGPRSGVMYRRLGFEDAGQMHRLELT